MLQARFNIKQAYLNESKTYKEDNAKLNNTINLNWIYLGRLKGGMLFFPPNINFGKWHVKLLMRYVFHKYNRKNPFFISIHLIYILNESIEYETF